MRYSQGDNSLTSSGFVLTGRERLAAERLNLRLDEGVAVIHLVDNVHVRGVGRRPPQLHGKRSMTFWRLLPRLRDKGEPWWK